MSQSNKIHKIYKKWIISIYSDLSSIIINIQKIDSKITYQSSFDFKYLIKFKLLISKETINDIIQFIINLIENNKIYINENENESLKLILLSDEDDNSNIELVLNLFQFEDSNNNENKILNNKNELNNLQNKQINLIQNKELEEIIKELYLKNNNLEEKIEELTLENKKLNEKIKILENKETIEKEELNKIISSYNQKLINIETQIKNLNNSENKTHLKYSNLRQINSISPHNNCIRNVKTFPSGKIISVSVDKSIKIYNKNFQIIQNISNAHDDAIIDISIKDENNFVTCSKDKNIKTWIKRNIEGMFKDEIEFTLNNIIEEAHNDIISKVIFCLNGNIISCSLDKKIKIWEEKKKNNYECIKILSHLNYISSILIIEDKNILISSGVDGTNFWSFDNYDNIIYIKDTWCGGRNALKRLDNDRIIIGGSSDGIIKIISLSDKIIIKEIINDFLCWGICVIKEKGVFLIGGKSNNINVYRNDNYQCIQIINNAHSNYINGIIELKDKSILSFSDDKTMNIWSF